MGAEPPLRRRRKKHSNFKHKMHPRNASRPPHLNRRYQLKTFSKGRSEPTRTKYREQMYRRFNCTKERMRFLCNPQTCRKAGISLPNPQVITGEQCSPLHWACDIGGQGKPCTNLFVPPTPKSCTSKGRELHQRSPAAPPYIGLRYPHKL